MERINFTEEQLTVIDNITNASYERGVFMGIILSLGSGAAVWFTAKIISTYGTWIRDVLIF